MASCLVTYFSLSVGNYIVFFIDKIIYWFAGCKYAGGKRKKQFPFWETGVYS